MIVGPNTEPKHIIDVYLCGRKLEGPFWADDQVGEAWVDIAPFESAHPLEEMSVLPGGYAYQGAAVYLLKGKIEIRLTPESSNLSLEEATDLINRSDNTITIDRITEFGVIPVLWPADREKFRRTNLFCNDDILDVLHHLKYYNSCACVRCKRAEAILEGMRDQLGFRAGFGACVFCGSEATEVDDWVCLNCKR